MLSPFKPNYKVRFVTGSSFYFIAFGNKRGILESDEKIARCGIFIKKEQECEVRTSPPDLVGYCADMRIFASRKNAVFLSKIYDSLQELFKVTDTLFLILFKLSPAL